MKRPFELKLMIGVLAIIAFDSWVVETRSCVLSQNDLPTLRGGCSVDDNPGTCPACPPTPGCGNCGPAPAHVCGSPGALAGCINFGGVVHKIRAAIVAGLDDTRSQNVLCYVTDTCGANCVLTGGGPGITYTCPTAAVNANDVAKWTQGNLCFPSGS